MTSKPALCCFVVVLAVLVAGCAPPPPTPVPPPASRAEPTATSAAGVVLPDLLIRVQGPLEIRHRGADRFVPTGFGARVQAGDLLRVPAGSAAAVFCGDQSQWSASPRVLSANAVHGIPCTAGSAPRPGRDLSAVRGQAAGADTPYVLAPRTGRISTDRPTLAWHAPDGAGTYTVRLAGYDGLDRPAVTLQAVERREVAGRSAAVLRYPGGWPPLQAGVSYTLIVDTATGSSHTGAPDPGFSLMSAEQAAELHGRAEMLRARLADDVARALLLAELYRVYELYADAIDLLAGVPGGWQSIPVQRNLGETYLAVGLPGEAQVAWTQALALAQAAALPEEAAEANAGLAWTGCVAGDKEAAATYRQLAQAIYRDIGMAERARELEAELRSSCLAGD